MKLIIHTIILRGGEILIIYKDNKSYVTRQDIPNENWTGEDVYVVDDNSELAQRIINAHPYYELVVEDGELVDIVELERPPSPPPEPTPIEEISNYLLDVDMRLVMMELGL